LKVDFEKSQNLKNIARKNGQQSPLSKLAQKNDTLASRILASRNGCVGQLCAALPRKIRKKLSSKVPRTDHFEHIFRKQN
jgi:hypothetical protein